LRETGVLDNTVVIITSDHGEEFGEHGVRGHGTSLNRNVIHVPLLILAPGSEGGGVRATRAVGLDRLTATVVDMAGLTDDSPFPGVPLTLGDDAATDTPVDILSEVTSKPHRPPGGWRSLIDQEHHYIDGPEGEQLFALSDPGQLRDLSSSEEGPRLLESFRARLEALLAPRR
jgi:arylsulfatase A-like enzyme